jgi:hypothetical protein
MSSQPLGPLGGLSNRPPSKQPAMAVIRLCGREFQTVREVWDYLMTLPDERRYRALGDLAAHMMNQSNDGSVK